MTPKRFLELMEAEGCTVRVHKERVKVEGGAERLIRRAGEFLANHPDFEAAVIALLDSMTVAEYLQELHDTGLNYHVEGGRVILSGGTVKARDRCTSILSRQPDLEAKLILMRAVNDPELMDSIQERACIRWSDGYSDSLMSAVLFNITPLNEVRSTELLPRSDLIAELSSLQAV